MTSVTPVALPWRVQGEPPPTSPYFLSSYRMKLVKPVLSTILGCYPP
jgi:hypothetical protein